MKRRACGEPEGPSRRQSRGRDEGRNRDRGLSRDCGCEWGQDRGQSPSRGWGDEGYTVRELAELSGCTVRTLHHYDELGLVRARRAANGYRRYGPAEVGRLQQVLLYRECDMPLADIKRLLDDPSFDARGALAGHLRELKARRKRLDGLIASVERTLACTEGADAMSDRERFEAFKQGLVEDNERRYGAEARGRWGDAAVDASSAKVRGMTEGDYEHAQALEQEVKDALAAALRTGDPAGAEARRAADLHRQWLCCFWQDGAYSKEAHRGLAEAYVADDRFKAYYDAVAPGAAEFLRDAIRAYCA
ncbi:MerR family transcriptional regulator [Gordonibacter sp. An230]|uniref:MerR family transcriptional regulator n=1 Tax=Gordonibacter sp. An230 TaxID=1965592 RepID=UPI000B388C76|nr:MerR family transcriptional regulator [Gordonibacter sp. An230]OUO91778.1 MerR family transcriptional regulator [Gordonibacter sp. An230]